MTDVVVFGLGPIGARIARRVLVRPPLRLAGAIDIDPAKAGQDVGEVIGAGRTGLPVVSGIERLGQRGRGAVAVHATSSSLEAVTPQLVALAEAGFNVVSTCEELNWPYERPDAAKRIDSAARAANVTVVGSGINPGFLMDTLPLVLSAACTRVDAVRVRRVVDTNQRRVPLQQKAGVGMPAEEFRARAVAGTIGHVGLRQSMSMLADGLGWRLDRYEETIEPVIAARDTETGLGTVSAGGVIGQRQAAIGTIAGSEVISFDLEMSAGAQPIDTITIAGEPNVWQVIEGGINGDTGTEAMIVNLIPVVAVAAAGLLTMRDLYPVTCRVG